MDVKQTGGVFSEDVVNQTLSLTTQQIVDYANAVKCDKPCAACGAQDWHVPQLNHSPVILRAPNVRDNSMAEWHFQMVCQACGCNRLISASYVWTHFFAEEADKN